MEGTRRCTACGLEKDLHDFFRRRDSHGVSRLRRSRCKDCVGPEKRAATRAHAEKYPERVMFRAARNRAALAGVPFEIEISDIEIPATCPVLGVPLVLHHGRRGPRDSSPTLDRIVPSRGYVRGNIIVVSWRVNRLKSDATMDELARIIDWYRSMNASL